MKKYDKNNLRDHESLRAQRRQRLLQKQAQIEEKGRRIANKNRISMGLDAETESLAETVLRESAEVVDSAACSDSQRYLELTKVKKADSESSSAEPDAGTGDALATKNNPRPKKRFSRAIIVSIAVSAVAIALLLALLGLVALGVLARSEGGLIPPTASDLTLDSIADKIDFALKIFGYEIGSFDSGDEGDTDAIDRAMRSTVVVFAENNVGGSTGSGIIYTADGYIITNHHIIEGATEIFVQLYGSKDYVKAELIGSSEHDDVAVIKVKKTALESATFATDLSGYRVGDKVYSIGAPNGHDYSYTVTGGIISAVNRDVKIYGGDETLDKKMRMIQTDAAVNPGNSGGPLVDADGRVVGIVTLKLDGLDGMGFALPSDGVIPIVDEIIKSGNANAIESTIVSGRPLIGVVCVSVVKDQWYVNTVSGIAPVTKEYAERNPGAAFCPEEDGVLVKSTTAGMDAHGKLFAGDIITQVANVRVYTSEQLMSILNDHKGGDTVTLTVYRNGEKIKVNVTLKEAPIE